MVKQQDLEESPYLKMVERMTIATETEHELVHRLHIEKVKLYANLAGIAAIFITLVLLVFLHPNQDFVKIAGSILGVFASGFIGFLLKRN